MKKIGFQHLTHVGTMDRDLKDANSYEGNGLSVSVNPIAWSKIARIGDEGFVLRRSDLQEFDMLDARRLTKAEKAEITAWGVENELLVAAEMYKASYYDVDLERRAWFECATRQEAQEELEGLPRKKVEGPISVMVATPKLMALSDQSRPTASASFSFDLTLIAYAERKLAVDGVWWSEALDPDNLSAPRGVLFDDTILRLDVKPMDFGELYEDDDINELDLEDLFEEFSGPEI